MGALTRHAAGTSRSLARISEDPRTPALALGLLALVAGVVIFATGHGLNFYYDDWAMIMTRRHGGLETFLSPYIQGLFAVPIAAFRILFSTVGLADYWPYRLVLVVAHLVTVALVFSLVRRRLGDPTALLVAVPILFLGAGWQVLFHAIHYDYFGALIAGLGAFLMLERGDRRGDLAACGLLIVALASQSLAVGFAVGAAVELMLAPERRRRIWVAVLPLALFAAWYLAFAGAVSSGSRSSLTAAQAVLRLPLFLARSAAATAGGLVGLGEVAGVALVIVGVLLAGRRLARGGRISPRLVALVAALLVFWVLLGLARPESAAGSRYIYVAGVLATLIAAEVWRGERLSTRGLGVLAAVVLAAAALNYGDLVDGAGRLRRVAAFESADLRALEVAGKPATAATFRPDPFLAPAVSANGYFAAVEELGSPADTPTQLGRRGEAVRRSADATLAEALGIALRGDTGGGRELGEAARLDSRTSTTVSARGSCLALRPLGGQGTVALTLPPKGVLLETTGGAPTTVALRHFADRFSLKAPSRLERALYGTPLSPSADGLADEPRPRSVVGPERAPPRPPLVASAPGAGRLTLRLPVHEPTGRRWHLLLVSTHPVRVCGLR